MNSHIAVDVGGTQLRAACYPENSMEPSQVERISTRAAGMTALDRLKDLIASVWPAVGKVAGIGVAAPGPLDPYNGVILAAPNIPGWVELPLRRHLLERFDVPVALGNDANLAALGEWHFGAGQGHHHLIYLTVSTGIGGGIIINDQLVIGQRGLAAELGHVSVMVGGPPCGCGQHGHLEAVASGTAIARWVTEQIASGRRSSLPVEEPITAKMVSLAARAGDELSRQALERAGSYLGRAIADYLHIFNPSIVVIGGGVSRSGDLLFDPLWASLRKHVLTPHYLDNFTLVTAALGDNAGLLGALALARSFSSPVTPAPSPIRTPEIPDSKLESG